MTDKKAREILNILKEYERAYQYSKEEVVGALDMANKALEQASWIPVSEGLPPIGDEVIVTTVWGEVTKAERYGSGNEDWFIHEGATNAKTEDILAWKPRPQPYKEEQDGKNNTGKNVKAESEDKE